MVEPIESLDAEAVLATFDVSLLPGESIRAATQGLDETCAIASDRRVFMVKRFFLGTKPNEWDYSNLTGVSLELNGSTGHLVLEGPGLKSVRLADDRAVKKADHALEPGPDDLPTAEQCAETIRGLISGSGQHSPKLRPRRPLGTRDLVKGRTRRSRGCLSVSGGSEVAALLRELAQLRDEGVITGAEFEAKKTELLRRL